MQNSKCDFMKLHPLSVISVRFYINTGETVPISVMAIFILCLNKSIWVTHQSWYSFTKWNQTKLAQLFLS